MNHYSAQLPVAVCGSNALNYTLLIADAAGRIISENGPFQLPGTQAKMLFDVSNLTVNTDYTLKVQAEVYSQIVTSYNVIFSKSTCSRYYTYCENMLVLVFETHVQLCRAFS